MRRTGPLLGGELLIAEVLRTDGSRQGVHHWNLLPDGTEIDLTRDQFASSEVVQEPEIVRRPAGLPTRGAQQYLTDRLQRRAALPPGGRPAPRRIRAGEITDRLPSANKPPWRSGTLSGRDCLPTSTLDGRCDLLGGLGGREVRGVDDLGLAV
jgi:hypothetical protein